MEIMEIIDMMEETIEKSPTVPLSGKIVVDKEDLLDYIQEMRLVFPDEVKEAKWVKEERERILAEAQTRSETMMKAITKMIPAPRILPAESFPLKANSLPWSLGSLFLKRASKAAQTITGRRMIPR